MSVTDGAETGSKDIRNTVEYYRGEISQIDDQQIVVDIFMNVDSKNEHRKAKTDRVDTKIQTQCLQPSLIKV